MGTTYVDGSERGYTVGASNVTAYKLVETTSGVVVCTASSTGYVGVTMNDALATYTVPVRGWNAAGTTPVTSSGSIAADAPLTFAAGGCVTTWTPGKYLVGWARSAAASGAEVEAQLCQAYMPATDAGLSRDVGTVTFSSVVAGDEVTFTPLGESGVTFTAVASGATPTELQFRVGAATNAAGDITAMGNLCAAVNASATALAAGITAATPTTAAGTFYCDTRMEIIPSSGDGAKVVCANHTNEAQFGELKDRIGWLYSQNEDRDTEITALETNDRLVLPAATGNIAAHTIVTPALDTVAKFAYASTSVLGPLFVADAAATAAANCIGTQWLSRATHTVQTTAAAVAIGDLLYLNASGVVATVAAGAGKVVIGMAVSAAGESGGTISVAPMAPYITTS